MEYFEIVVCLRLSEDTSDDKSKSTILKQPQPYGIYVTFWSVWLRFFEESETLAKY